ncbi:MAG: alpha/beta fold hydrolase [Gemmatimonadota bacterium]
MLNRFLRSTVLIASVARAGAAQVTHPCETSKLGPKSECGTYSVFEDRASRAGRRIDINFVVLRAQLPAGKEPVFLFAGGPGQGSTALAGLGSGVLKPVREIRDIVLVDQRGSGGSNPLDCETEGLKNPAAAFGHVFHPDMVRRCREALSPRANLTLYGTDLAVADIDDIRQALGYDRVILWGGSYGTRLAQAYMRRFPDRVAAAVLDGVVPFDFAAPLTYARTLQASLDHQLASCRERAACRDSFPTLDQDFATIVERFRKGPVQATVRVKAGAEPAPVTMSLGDFGYAVRGVLYSAEASRGLPGMIHRAAAGSDLSEFAQRYWERVASFAGEFSDGLHFSIFCSEDIPFIGDDAAKAQYQGSFIGSYLLDEYRGACAGWEAKPVAESERRPLSSNIPTLLLSGFFDPVTPPEMGARVARTLSVSRHIVVANTAHGSGFGCARAATLHVLVKGTLEGLPAVCDEPPRRDQR